MSLFIKKIWWKWKKTIHKLNDGIAFVLMTITYVTAVMPVALSFKIIRRPMLDRTLGDPKARTHWLKRNDPAQDIRRVQKMY